MKSALRKTIQWILLLCLLLGILIQTLGFWNYNPTSVSTKTRIGMVISLIQLIVVVWYGMSYGNKEYSFKEAVKNWLEGVVTLIIFNSNSSNYLWHYFLWDEFVEGKIATFACTCK